MAAQKLIVLSNPTSGKEAEFNDWYDNTHVPDVLDVPGVVRARRYKVLSESEWSYAAIYELDCDNPATLIHEMSSRIEAGTMVMSDAIDMVTLKFCVVELLGD